MAIRVLGIDPGAVLIGYGIIEKDSQGWHALTYGAWQAPKNTSAGQKAEQIFGFFNRLIKTYQPQQAALEQLFFFKNAKTVMRVSEVRGILLLALQKNKVPVKEFTPLQVKQAVSAYGRAEKSQVQKMVSLILKLKELPQPDDAADALAIALCCAHTTKF